MLPRCVNMSCRKPCITDSLNPPPNFLYTEAGYLHLYYLAVQQNFHFLIIKGNQACNDNALLNRVVIVPDNVLVLLSIQDDIVVLCNALIRTD